MLKRLREGDDIGILANGDVMSLALLAGDNQKNRE
jgi:transketolase C-terminal domain/subunit